MLQKKISLSLFIITFLLMSCTEKAMVQSFNENIENVNNFEDLAESDDSPLQDIKVEKNKTYQFCQKSSINAKELKISALAKLLSKVYNTNVQAENGFETSELLVSMNLQNVCLEQILDYLIQAYEIGYNTTSYGYVLSVPKLKTKVFNLDYHNFNRNSSSNISITGSQLSNTSNNYIPQSQSSNVQPSYSAINTSYQESFWDNIEKTLNMIVFDPNNKTNNNTIVNQSNKWQDTSQISLHRNTGTIIVKAYPSTLQLVEEFLVRINGNTLKQVVIEAKILEVTLNEEFHNGIQWELLKKKLYMTSFNHTILKPKINDVYNTINLAADGPVSSIISGKISNSTDFASVIQALSTQGKVSILSSPRVSTLNNQRALIKYGDEQFFITNVVNTTTNNNTNTNTQQSGFNLSPFFSGIALDATPHILNNRQILLHIHPIITRVTMQTQNILLNGQNTEIPLPMIQSREADTVLKAISGDMVILGGLTQGNVNLNSSGLPIKEGKFLSKFFNPFAAKQNVSTKTELVILLKPTIISGKEYIGNKSKLAKYLIDTDSDLKSDIKPEESCE